MSSGLSYGWWAVITGIMFLVVLFSLFREQDDEFMLLVVAGLALVMSLIVWLFGGYDW